MRTKEPPYLLGLLCLIPLIGALIGLGLLLYGVFKYKDKWLSLIGVAGILFTVGIYFTILPFLRFGDLIKKGGSALGSRVQLNSLVKDIEFYKIQHGQYPDSLQELLNDDMFAPINDPIQVLRQGRNSNYNYQKTGDKYLLFSSGEDGIPNSKDDLFPQVNIGDSSKIGLIRSE